MTQWQPDPRQQQRPATPPQWQQAGQPPADPWAGSAPGGAYGQPQYQPGPQQPPYQGYQPPQYPPPGPPQRPRRSRKGIASLGCGGLLALVILIVVLAGHSSPSSPAPAAGTQTAQAAAPPAPGTAAAKAAAAQTVTYEVTGSDADVTYGPTGTSLSGSVPMKVTKPLGTPLYYSITAQLQGAGSVSCKIEVDGKVISQGTATGGYNIAQCEISPDPLSGQWTDTNG
jgi:hypothetical protein